MEVHVLYQLPSSITSRVVLEDASLTMSCKSMPSFLPCKRQTLKATVLYTKNMLCPPQNADSPSAGLFNQGLDRFKTRVP